MLNVLARLCTTPKVLTHEQDCSNLILFKFWLILKNQNLSFDKLVNLCKEGEVICRSTNHSYMPYLTLWDKISQNLARLEANSHKIIKSHRIFRPSLIQHILWRNKHKSHFVVFITSFLHINKAFWLLWWSFKVIFVKISQNIIKSHFKICLVSQISVHSLWHVCSLSISHRTNYLSYNKFLGPDWGGGGGGKERKKKSQHCTWEQNCKILPCDQQMHMQFLLNSEVWDRLRRR